MATARLPSSSIPSTRHGVSASQSIQIVPGASARPAAEQTSPSPASGSSPGRRLTEPDPDLPPVEALTKSLDGFLLYVEENELAYRKLMESAGSAPGVRALIDDVREATAARLIEGVDPDPPPKVRAAVAGWLWFMDGAIFHWLDHRGMDRTELRDLLLGTLAGTLAAAGASLPG